MLFRSVSQSRYRAHIPTPSSPLGAQELPISSPPTPSRFVDTEAQKSGEGHSDDDESISSQEQREIEQWIDNSEHPEDIDDYHAMYNKKLQDQPTQPYSQNHDTYEFDSDLDDWVARAPTPTIPTIDHMPKPSLRRTDTDERNFLTTAQTIPKDKDGYGRESFRLRHKKIGLTYPQCSLRPQLLIQYILNKFHNYEPDLIIVGREKHKDNMPHLHAYISFKKTFNSMDQRCFDIDIYHPNIRKVLNPNVWIAYVTKGDDITCYPSTFDYKVFQQQRIQKKNSTTQSQLIVNDIRNGYNLKQLLTKYPSFMLMHEKQVTNYISKLRQQQSIDEMNFKWDRIKKFVGQGIKDMAVAGWLNDHLLKKHGFRQNNLWIKGPTKCGKTSLVELLKENGCIILNVNLTSPFYDGISDDTQLLVFDEYKAQKTICDMNSVSDGSRSRLNIKGSSYQLIKPMPVLVLSNFTIKEAYCNSDQDHLKTLLSRFTLIEYFENEHITIVPVYKQ